MFQGIPDDFVATTKLYSSLICRWKQILEAYNEVRGCLLNCGSLLEGTRLVLFSINESTLTKWYKNSSRHSEVKMLLQGLTVLPSSSTAAEPLLPACEHSSSLPPPPENPHTFPDVEDRRGLAQVRTAPTSSSSVPKTTPPGTLPPTQAIAASKSRTTEWRHRKLQEADASPPLKRARKEYCCSVCNEAMSTG